MAISPFSQGDLLSRLRAAGSEIFSGVLCRSLPDSAVTLETISPEETLFDAVNRMWWRQVGALPVVQDGELVGCFSEEDLLRVMAERLADLGGESAPNDALRVWHALLRDLRAGEVMTPLSCLPIVSADTSLWEGLQRCSPATPGEAQNRYLFVVNSESEQAPKPNFHMLSFRDVARFLTRLYDGRCPPQWCENPIQRARAQATVREILDLRIGELRRHIAFGHAPVIVPADSSVQDAIAVMWETRRGYVLALFADGAPLGICTRRDILHLLADPFVHLGRARLLDLMSPQVKTVTTLDTLCGLFKFMALEACRHMTLLDRKDRAAAVISIWEGVGILLGTDPDGASRTAHAA